MKYSFFYILVFTLASTTFAHSKAKEVGIWIQTLNPPSKNINISDTLNIAIIANIYNDTRPDSLIQENYPTDSVIAVKAAFALKTRLQESPLFIDYDFPIYNYKRNDNKTLKTGITLDIARDMANDVQADYLLTVDVVNTQLYYEMGYVQVDGGVYAYAASKVPVFFIFRLYDIRNNKILDEQTVGDTIIFDALSGDIDADVLINDVLTGEDAVIEASKLTAEAYANLITPYWLDEERYFYNDNSKEMKNAEKHVGNQEWCEAMEIWMELTSLANLKRAALACFNMALGCEMTGDFDLAFEWLKVAKSKNLKLNTDKYEEILLQRKNHKTMIDRNF